MPAYNSAHTLRASAASVLDQSFRDLELIVVDDGSTDATKAITRRLMADDARVRVIHRHRSSGPAVARNDAIAIARGRYVAFCDADDLWLPHKIERQIELANRTGAALVYSSYHRVAADFADSPRSFRSEGRVVRVPSRLPYEQLLYRNLIGCLTAMFDRERTGDVRMPNHPGAEDWALWLRILREGGHAAGVTDPLALYRCAHPDSFSSRRMRAARAVWRVLRTEEGLGRPGAAVHLTTDAVAALRKQRV